MIGRGQPPTGKPTMTGSGPDYSKSGGRTVLASRFPADGGALDRLDKALTAPWAYLVLPYALEVVLSIPGCFFGMPTFLVAGPLLTAALIDGGGGAVGPAALFGGLLVAVWLAGVVAEKRACLAFVYSKGVMVAAPLLGAGLATACAAPAGAAAARYAITLWLCAMVPVAPPARRPKLLERRPSGVIFLRARAGQ